MGEPLDPNAESYQPYPSMQPVQQPYPNQPYGQPYPPPYGQQYPQPGYANYPPLNFPPPKRSNPALLAAILVVAAVAVGAIVWGVVAATGGSKNSPYNTTPLTMPAALGGYARLDDATSDRIRTAINAEYGTSGQLGTLFAKATIGVYGTDQEPRYVVLAARSGTVPGLDPSSLNAGALSGIATFTNYPSGPLGGALYCTQITLGAETVSECLWADSHTIGFVVSPPPGSAPSDLAGLTNTARDTLDH